MEYIFKVEQKTQYDVNNIRPEFSVIRETWEVTQRTEEERLNFLDSSFGHTTSYDSNYKSYNAMYVPPIRKFIGKDIVFTSENILEIKAYIDVADIIKIV